MSVHSISYYQKPSSTTPRKRTQLTKRQSLGAINQHNLITKQLNEQKRNTRNLKLGGSTSNGNLKPVLPKNSFDHNKFSRAIDQFISSLSMTSLTRPQIQEVETLGKNMKNTAIHYSRFPSLSEDQIDTLWGNWDSMTRMIKNYLKSNTSAHSIQSVANQLQKAKNSLNTTSQKISQPSADSMGQILSRFDELEAELREVENLDKAQNLFKSLRQLQGAVPTAKCNQEIGRVLLSLQSIREAQRSESTITTQIHQTHSQFQQIIPDKNASAKSVRSRSSSKKSGFELPKSVKSRARSTTDKDDRMSYVSGMSRKSLSRVPPSYQQFDNQITELMREISRLTKQNNSLKTKIDNKKQYTSDLQQKYDDIIEEHNQQREALKNQLKAKKTDKSIDNRSGAIEAEISELKFKQQKLQSKLELAQYNGTNEISEQTEYYKELMRLYEDRRDAIEDEMARVRAIHSSLVGDRKEFMEVSLDNQQLKRQISRLKKEMEKIDSAIESLQKVRESDIAIDLLKDENEIPEDELSIAYQKAVAENEALKKWYQELKSQIETLNEQFQELSAESYQSDYKEELLASKTEELRLKKIAQPNPLLKEISKNNSRINKLSRSITVTPPEDRIVEDQRIYNQKLIERTEGMILKYNEELSKSDPTSEMLEVDDQSTFQEAVEARVKYLDRAYASLENTTFLQELYKELFDEETDEEFEDIFSKVRDEIQALVDSPNLPNYEEEEFEGEAKSGDFDFNEYYSDEGYGYSDDN